MLEYRDNFVSAFYVLQLIAKNNNCFSPHYCRLPVICLSVQDYGFCVRWFITELDLFILRLKVTYVIELFLKMCTCVFL